MRAAANGCATINVIEMINYVFPVLEHQPNVDLLGAVSLVCLPSTTSF